MILNAAFPLLNGIDSWLGDFLPLVLRVWIWGLLAGAVAIGFYALVSNQPAIRTLKDEARGLRRQMLDLDLDEHVFKEASKKNLRVSFVLLGRVFGPGLLSALPILVVAAWLDTYHGHALPADGEPVRLLIAPAEIAVVIRPEAGVRRSAADAIALVPTEIVTVTAGAIPVYRGNPFTPPVRGVGKKQWWNALLASENGYIDPDSPVEEIRLELAVRRVVEGLPGWAAGWELSYFLAALLAALAVKLVFRVA